MGYLIKAPLGLAMFVGGIVLFNVKLVELLETGTCASGNVPYEIAPGYQCPSDTGTDILLLAAGIIGGLIGVAIFAFRGDPPWNREGRNRRLRQVSFGVFAWGAFFTATGATSLFASLTNEAIKESNGGELGGIIVGATFLLMGVPALLLVLWQSISGFGSRDERPAPMTAAAAGVSSGGVMSRMTAGLEQARAARQLTSRLPWGSSSGSSSGGGTGGQIAKLERLQKLRESGALTDAEFEREKAKVLAEG
jgi:Short C-terminal domain